MRVAVVASLLLVMVSCAEITIPTSFPISIPTGDKPLTTAEITEGLKEALKVGAKNSIGLASQTDGFFKNPQLFIPFPPEAEKVKNTLVKAGFTKQVDEFTMTLNRAAEKATEKALPIFVSAITQMTISDAIGILKGNDNAATEYLRRTTSAQLQTAFKPIARDAISTVNLTSYWEPLANTYNKLTILTGGKAVNPNLEDYVTQKAIDGLFILIAKEEKSIRENPAARVTDILKRVFANTK